MPQEELNLSNKSTWVFIKQPKKILSYLHLGISIPIWPEFHKYILHDLNFFKAQSLLLIENGTPSGHMLIYDGGDNVLYFGYFGTKSHDREVIQALVSRLIVYAKKNNFKTIRGPINIPTVIYGWGFMKEGSSQDIFAGKPVNPPIYQQIFLANDFAIKIKETSWEGPLPQFDPSTLTQFDFSDYEVFWPKDWNELMDLKEIFQEHHAKYLPPSSIITPKINDLFDNYAEYVYKFGGNTMFFFVRHKPTGKIIASGSNLPNPFQKDESGNDISFVAYTVAVEPAYRKKGISLLMTGTNFLRMGKKNMRYISGPANSSHEVSTHIARKIELLDKRTHLIMELRL